MQILEHRANTVLVRGHNIRDYIWGTREACKEGERASMGKHYQVGYPKASKLWEPWKLHLGTVHLGRERGVVYLPTLISYWSKICLWHVNCLELLGFAWMGTSSDPIVSNSLVLTGKSWEGDEKHVVQKQELVQVQSDHTWFWWSQWWIEGDRMSNTVHLLHL